MKSLFFTVILLALTLNSFAEDDRKRNISQYYELINKAELSIIDNNLKEASACYGQAFQYKFANYKDLENAFSVAYQLGDSVLARTYAGILFAEGISVKYSWIATDSANHPQLFNYVVQDEDSIIDRNVFKYKQQPNILFDSLDKMDQYVRTHTVSKDSAIKTDDTVAEIVLDYIRMNGYPVLDINNPRATMYRVVYNCFILIWHMRDRDSFPALDSLLSQELLKGNLQPDEWMLFMLNRKGYHEKFGNAIWRLDWPGLTPQQTALINENRRKLNLENIQDYKKKYDYEQQLQKKYGCTQYGHVY
ncbi:MAG: hypothetical protein EOP48_20270, partial [Sphingobacteriales bacterium]